ncbi:hypothetical protein [Alkalihalobacillus deserti]|nr:hypothetical protein [Alkalihalobacillus deserti]
MKKDQESFNFVFWISMVFITVFIIFGAVWPDRLSQFLPNIDK